MPVVARSIPTQSGLRSVRLLPRILFIFITMAIAQRSIAQESGSTSGPDSGATPNQESTPLPETIPAAKVLPETATGEATPAAADAEGCLKEILAQQQLTRTLRDMRKPLLPPPKKEDVDKLKREYDRLLKNGFGVTEVKVIQDTLAYRILQATDGDFVLKPANMQGLLQDVENDIANSGKGIPQRTTR